MYSFHSLTLGELLAGLNCFSSSRINWKLVFHYWVGYSIYFIPDCILLCPQSSTVTQKSQSLPSTETTSRRTSEAMVMCACVCVCVSLQVPELQNCTCTLKAVKATCSMSCCGLQPDRWGEARRGEGEQTHQSSALLSCSKNWYPYRLKGPPLKHVINVWLSRTKWLFQSVRGRYYQPDRIEL